MKQINTYSGRSYLVEDDELENIKKLLFQGSKMMIELRSGEGVHIPAIETYGSPDTEAYFLGNPMNKNKTKVLVQGE